MRCWVRWTVVITHIVRTRSYTSTLPWSHPTSSLLPRNMSADAGNRKSDSKEASPSTSEKSSPNKNNNDDDDGSFNRRTSGSSESGSEAPVDTTSTTDVDVEAENNNNQVRDTSPTTGGRVTRQSLRLREEIDLVKAKYLSLDLESKRELYKGTYVTLENIKTWPDYFRENLKQDKDRSPLGKEKEVEQDLNKKISLFHGDITTLEIDAIVNAANESLLGGGGVDGAIHHAAGPHLRSECVTLYGCEPGQAKITGGYNLAAKYIIHTVGPREEHPQVLRQCYLQCMNLVKQHQLTSVAFPCISTGIFGYPNANATKVALSTVRQWLEKDEYAKHVERVIFCLFLRVDVEAYHSLMPVYFPVEPPVDSNVKKSPSSDKSEKEESPSSSSEDGKCDSKEEAELRKD